jgi:hypothetical protein
MSDPDPVLRTMKDFDQCYNFIIVKFIGNILMLLKLISSCALSSMIIGTAFGAEESYSEASCKKASGYSKSMMKAVAEGIGVPESSLKYEGSFYGGGPTGGCAGMFSTPKGPYECAMVAWTSDKGKNFFIGPPAVGLISGMQNLCRKAR